jgi:cell division protein FtsL
MSRRFVWLVFAVMATAMFVIQVRHQSRLLFSELQMVRAEGDELNTEWGQLLLEEGTWSEHRRVEAMARTRLDMNIPSRDRIVVVRSGESR